MLVECKNCGAPLDIKSGARYVKCRYCGRQNEVRRAKTIAVQTPQRWQAPQVWRPPQHVPIARAAPQQQELRYKKSGGCGSVVIALVVGLIGLGVAIFFVSGGPGAIAAATWDGSTTYVCGPNEQVTLSGVKAEVTGGPAISAKANCQLRLKNVKLTGPIGIEAEANAKIVLYKSTIKGEQIGVKAGDNARIELKSSTVEGQETAVEAGANLELFAKSKSKIKCDQVGLVTGPNAKVELQGSELLASSTAAELGDNSSLTLLKGSTVTTTGDAVRAGENLTLIAKDKSKLKGDKLGVNAKSHPKIELHGGSSIESAGTAIEVTYHLKLELREGSLVNAGTCAVCTNSNTDIQLYSSTIQSRQRAITGNNNCKVHCESGTITGQTAFDFKAYTNLRLKGCRVSGRQQLGRNSKLDERP